MIPVPERADLAIGSWTCGCGQFGVNELTGSQYGVMVVQCPNCGESVEILPLPSVSDE